MENRCPRIPLDIKYHIYAACCFVHGYLRKEDENYLKIEINP
ncbi:MAG: hypothetical protein P8Y70_01180 [Candidatus Lokiarchaeota archaeon]